MQPRQKPLLGDTLDPRFGRLALLRLVLLAMTAVVLHPTVEFSGEKMPSREEVEHLHHEAHDACFIANSVKTVVRVEPVFQDPA